ncbi:MAG: MMPL family transporter [Proteobacteria bacterium]|nr:MMPL family transporter [Pseudomonadota bacterium]
MQSLMLWSRRHPWIVTLIIVLGSVFFAYGLPKIQIDSSSSGMMIQGDPARAYYDDTLKKFGSDNITVIFVKDKDLFTPEKLALLDEIHFQMEELAGVEKVESLFSVTNFKGEDGVLSVSPLMDFLPETLEQAEQIKADALGNPLLVNNIIAQDGNAVALNLFIRPDGEDPDFEIKLIAQIDKIISKSASRFDQIFQLGNSYVRKSIISYILQDQMIMLPLSVLVLMSILVLTMRSTAGAVLPMLTAGVSVLWSAGFMGFMGIPLNILTVVVPSLIIVIGSTEDIHLLSEYMDGLEHHNGEKLAAMDYMVSKTGTAVMLTALTTFMGFLSITLNQILILRQFGIVAAFGLFINPLVTCMIAPVFLHYFGPKQKQPKGKKKRMNDRVMTLLAEHIIHLIHTRKKQMFIGLIGGSILIGLFALNVRVDNELLGYFKPGSDIRVKSRVLHDEIAGPQLFYIRVSSGSAGFFKDPENLSQIAGLMDYMQAKKWFDKEMSLVGFLKLIHMELNNGDPSFYTLPKTKELIAQYLLTLQRGDIERYVTPDFSEANIMVRHFIGSSHELNTAVADVKNYITTHFNPHVKIGFTGENILVNAAADSMAQGQVKSLALLMVIIFFIMSLLFVNFKAGLLSLVPNAFPVLLVFGVMGILNIPLNVGTAMVGAIAIGIAVDDTVHFMTRYNREMRRLQDQTLAIDECIRSEIKPIVSTSIALAMGFLVVCFSSFAPIVSFGFLSALVMVFALLGDLFLTPILLSSTQLITIWDLVKLNLNRQVVKNSQLFNRLNAWQMKRVILLGRILETPRGEIAIHYGDPGDSMFLLLEGSAQVLGRDANGNKSMVATLTPGEVFGEIAMVDPGMRTADILATQNMKYLEFSWKGMKRIRLIYPRIAVHLYRNLAQILGARLKEATSQRIKMP